MDKVTRIAAGSIVVGCVVLGLKAVAWHITGSAALYSDALETVVNVVASAIALVALRVAAQPADQNHPFGHAKAEFLAASAEGALIVVAAASILQSAWVAWHNPHGIDAPLPGLALNGVATLINLGWAQLLFRAAKSPPSPVLAADGRHLMADVVTSCGVFLGVGLVIGTGRLWLDPLVAACTAVYVLWSGLRLLASSAGGLMDMAPPANILARIADLVKQNAEGAIEAHEIRTRQAGRLTFVQFHLVVPGAMRVDEAHEICDRIEAALKSDMSDLVVNIHVEPEHKAKHQDALVFQ
jgi:cation diffusion facilitator family transporter